jgi:hypothetical protein
MVESQPLYFVGRIKNDVRELFPRDFRENVRIAARMFEVFQRYLPNPDYTSDIMFKIATSGNSTAPQYQH